MTGSGIFVADVEDAVVQHSVAYNNGKNGTAPVGIWAAGSNRVVFQYNESLQQPHDARSATAAGSTSTGTCTTPSCSTTTRTTTTGPGFLIYAGSHHSTGNVIRYNVSQNDGRKNGKAGIQLGGNVTSSDVHNNVVFMKSSGDNSHRPRSSRTTTGRTARSPKNVLVRNNIFQTTGGVPVVGLTDNVAKNGKIKFNGNAYYSSGASFTIGWGNTKFKSLDAWRKSKKQESARHAETGFQGDPRLKAPGMAGTVNDYTMLWPIAAPVPAGGQLAADRQGRQAARFPVEQSEVAPRLLRRNRPARRRRSTSASTKSADAAAAVHRRLLSTDHMSPRGSFTTEGSRSRTRLLLRDPSVVKLPRDDIAPLASTFVAQCGAISRIAGQS